MLRLLLPEVDTGETSDHIDVIEVFVGDGNITEFSRLGTRENDSDSSSVAITVYIESITREALKTITYYLSLMHNQYRRRDLHLLRLTFYLIFDV